MKTNRREFLSSIALATAFYTVPGAFAEQLVATPPLTLGPFYPDHLIWQMDNNAPYIHSASQNAARRDKNFQGYGRFETSALGYYRFRTIKPVPYPGRTAHIHFLIKASGRAEFATQCFVQGEPGNAADNILNQIRDPQKRAAVVVPFVPIAGSKIGELAACFDVVY